MRWLDQRLGGRACLWEPMKDVDLNIKKLPLYVGQKIVDLIYFLNDKMSTSISELIYNKACEAEGIPTQRINLEQGFDLYKPDLPGAVRALQGPTPQEALDFNYVHFVLQLGGLELQRTRRILAEEETKGTRDVSPPQEVHLGRACL